MKQEGLPPTGYNYIKKEKNQQVLQKFSGYKKRKGRK
jgi:hypothetical protein